ncbi:MAG: hypothetical protein AB7N53_13280 [Candidatus Binatia bacterium]
MSTGVRWMAVVLLGVSTQTSTARAASIQVGSASGQPGERVVIDVTLSTDGAEVLATQNRIDFTRSTFIAAGEDGEPDCVANPQIRKEATAFRFVPPGCDPATNCESVRVFVLSFSNFASIPDGAVLYACAVQIDGDAAPGAYPLAIAEVGASASGGMDVPTTGIPGAVEVVTRPAARLVAGEAVGEPGQTMSITVTFELLVPPVVGVQNDLSFEPATPIAGAAGGEPACQVNPGIEKEATSFRFVPANCTPEIDCTGVRAFVFSATNLDPLPDGAVLYTCDVAIARDALAGLYPLRVEMALASSGAAGEPLAALGADGAIVVEEPRTPPPCAGDCDGNRVVEIGELLRGVNLVIGSPADPCLALDSDGNGIVTIAELVRAVSSALEGCPFAAT